MSDSGTTDARRGGHGFGRLGPLFVGVCGALLSLLFASHLSAAGPLTDVTQQVTKTVADTKSVVKETVANTKETVTNAGKETTASAKETVATASKDIGPVTKDIGTGGSVGAGGSQSGGQHPTETVGKATGTVDVAIGGTAQTVTNAAPTTQQTSNALRQGSAQPATTNIVGALAPGTATSGGLANAPAVTMTQPVASAAAPVIQAGAQTTAPGTQVAAPVVQTITTATQPAAQTATTTVAPGTQAAAPIVRTVVAPLAPVIAPVVQTAAPVVQTVTATVEQVAAPVAPVIAPIVQQVEQATGPVGSSVAPFVQAVQPVIDLGIPTPTQPLAPTTGAPAPMSAPISTANVIAPTSPTGTIAPAAASAAPSRDRIDVSILAHPDALVFAPVTPRAPILAASAIAPAAAPMLVDRTGHNLAAPMTGSANITVPLLAARGGDLPRGSPPFAPSVMRPLVPPPSIARMAIVRFAQSPDPAGEGGSMPVAPIGGGSPAGPASAPGGSPAGMTQTMGADGGHSQVPLALLAALLAAPLIAGRLLRSPRLTLRQRFHTPLASPG